MARDLQYYPQGNFYDRYTVFKQDTMMFEKNIKELRKINPKLAESVSSCPVSGEIKIVSSKTGSPSLRAGNISLHSLYDPEKEARVWVDHYREEIDRSVHIYVLGFGLGYHLLELCTSGNRDITVCEPSIEILRTALETVDLTPVLSRVTIITDSDLPSVSERPAILEHIPSVRLNSAYFNKICADLKLRGAISRGLRIIVVSPVCGGSLPVARYCAASLKKMGHTVELIDNSRFNDMLSSISESTGNRARRNRLTDILSSFLSEMVMARCTEFKPDLVLALAQAPLTPECVESLRAQKIITAYWFVEDFRFMNYWASIAGHYDFFFTVQKDEFHSEMEKSGFTNYHYLPVAASPDVHKPVELSPDEKEYYGSDLSFVGAGYYNRKHFLNGLIDFDLKIWGTYWDHHTALGACLQRGGTWIDTEDIVKIFNATEVNINLHSSTYHKGINPFGDFVNPRTFEIAACGAFQLVDRRTGLEGLFEIGEEVIVFDDLDDLRGKITYYLNHPAEREELTRKGMERTLRDHTYEKRMEQMLNIMAAEGCEPLLWTGEGEDLSMLIEEAGRSTALGKYLSRFADKGKIMLTDITEDIQEGEGSISETEAMFLLMKEFQR